MNFNTERCFRWLKKEFDDPEVYITENGWSDNGELNDVDRIEYYRLHLEEILSVVLNNECNLKGYTGMETNIEDSISTFIFHF